MAPHFEKLEELETRILRTVELVKTTRAEKEAVEKKLAGANDRIDQLEREVEELRRERDLVRTKVESLLANLTELTEETVV